MTPLSAPGLSPKQTTNQIQPGAPAGKDPKIWAAAQEFEAVLLGEFANLMVAMPQSEEPFGGGHGEEVWKGQLATQMGIAMARRGGLGLADHVYGEMLRLQGGQSNASQPNPAAAARYAQPGRVNGAIYDALVESSAQQR
jgi:peptidoglycan hydrolase FlgJ